MTTKFLKWLQGLIARGDVHPFYCTTQWIDLSRQVLEMDKHECQICKQRGRYHRAELVHHVNHVRDAPALALDLYYKDADGQQQRNLAYARTATRQSATRKDCAAPSVRRR